MRTSVEVDMNQADLLKSLLLILPHPITVDESCSASICQFSEDQNDTNIPKRNRPRSFGRGHLGVPINQECERAERREVDQPTIDNLILSVGRAVAGLEEFRGGLQSPLLCHRLCQKQLCLLAVWRKAERVGGKRLVVRHK